MSPAGEELNKHIASVLILLIVLNYLYIVCLSIEINMFIPIQQNIVMELCINRFVFTVVCWLPVPLINN